VLFKPQRFGSYIYFRLQVTERQSTDLWSHMNRSTTRGPMHTALIDWLWLDETMSQNCSHQQDYCSSPGDTWACRAMAMMMMPAEDNSWLVHQSSLAVLPQRHLGQIGGMDERVIISLIIIFDTSTDLLHAVKSYDMGLSRFTSHPKKGVLRIFIALKSPSPRPGLNPRPLGIVASTLTTTPPRGLIRGYYSVCL
jgi:hypothetical protein